VPCFIQWSGGIPAVIPALASCTPVRTLSARIAVLSKTSGDWTLIGSFISRSAGMTSQNTVAAYL